MEIFKTLSGMAMFVFGNSILWRIINIGTAVVGFLLLIGSITHETGSSSIFPFIIPVVVSIALILLFRDKNKLIQLLGYTCIIFAMFSQQSINGSFIHYTITGLGAFILLLNTLRPWNK